ncbi:hypothetical protein SISSUDRAFT_1076767 [Sistotremastrum suecicum HHB10207 ss-3]|uniref:Uncharacterized protein n=1 Tax=Sistotremastrum suecicum HHB10207 ss-3 TaxID=1314776 RepID=A0A166B5G6_9AGAM|nr:hypothetical protein SISSUDRAFT_1076767 [Sistotremastrum suecicum HHB10207 ss-3]
MTYIYNPPAVELRISYLADRRISNDGVFGYGFSWDYEMQAYSENCLGLLGWTITKMSPGIARRRLQSLNLERIGRPMRIAFFSWSIIPPVPPLVLVPRELVRKNGIRGCSFARGLVGTIVQFGTAYPKTVLWLMVAFLCIPREVDCVYLPGESERSRQNSKASQEIRNMHLNQCERSLLTNVGAYFKGWNMVEGAGVVVKLRSCAYRGSESLGRSSFDDLFFCVEFWIIENENLSEIACVEREKAFMVKFYEIVRANKVEMSSELIALRHVTQQYFLLPRLNHDYDLPPGVD